MYIIDNAAKLVLTAEQTAKIERLAEETGVDTRGGWEGEAYIRFNAVEAALSGSLIGRLKGYLKMRENKATPAPESSPRVRGTRAICRRCRYAASR